MSKLLVQYGCPHAARPRRASALLVIMVLTQVKVVASNVSKGGCGKLQESTSKLLKRESLRLHISVIPGPPGPRPLLTVYDIFGHC